MKHETLLNELFRFIKLMPEEILSECVNSIDYRNRSERRKYEKIKSLDNKIEALLQSVHCRVELIENLYHTCGIQEADDITYDEMISSINASNCISKILYILHCCCDDDFDRKYFAEFIQSEPFQKTIKNEWESAQLTNSEKTNVISKKDFKENEMMIYYLGYIELKTTYYNFIPQYIFNNQNKAIEEIQYSEFKTKFPERGAINLAYERYAKSYEFLKELNVDKVEYETEVSAPKNIYMVCFSDDEIEYNDNEKIQRKLNLQTIYNNGEELSARIKSVSELGMYKIAQPKDYIEYESFSDKIFIAHKENYNVNEKILLEYEDKFFGPYVLKERSYDGEKFVCPDSGLNKYILQYYADIDCEFMSFEKQFIQESSETEVAYVVGSPCHKDVISDALLLEKLKDNIDVHLLNSNPEEFSRLYSTSPFLGNVPNEIRNERNKRIQNICKSTADYDEIKKKALNTLIDSLDDEDELLATKIQVSKQYKKLQEKVANLQKENDEQNIIIEALGEENKKLKFDEEQNNVHTVAADIERIEELENENAELMEKLSVVENYELLVVKYDDLQKKYSQATALYDSKVIELNKKEKDLEDIKNKVQEFITNELSEANATKMLHTAFDPYISNAMIEAAGNYRIDEEAAQYKIISDEMLKLECQMIEKNALIDSLVEYVQKFRDYEKNVILNMYICLSQNFLTVFSGEPGTGKTSICNILANSLGLNKFGNNNNISKNRYVPVSVERGWSSKRDLIGYFNPLTKKYDRSNAKIYDGLMILNEENKESRFPYLILLDEANLSPMEYYWADFMRAADSSESDVFINIGLDKDIYIPKTLHFLATINNDQTTEQLSPRLVDRAWIVKLPTNRRIIEANVSVEDYFNSRVLWSDIEKAFVLSESKEMSLKAVAEQIYKLFNEHHLAVSPRVQQSIKNYVCIAQEIMEDEIGVTKKQKALDFAIVQKLLPKINGYYKDYERLFVSLTQICDENGLKMTKEALISMEEFQRQNMGYCQYLV